MLPDSFHRNLRRITTYYPFARGAALFSRVAGAIERPRRDRWLAIEPCGSAPPMELNLANALQRKIYYFTPCYATDYLQGPLATLMRRCLKLGNAVLDIGANLGWFSYLAADLVGPTGAVIAFEPNPEHHECIARTRDLNGIQQLSAEAIALANKEGTATFYLDYGGTRSSLVRGGTRGSPATVRVASLDALIAQGEVELDGLDFVKIDVEGAEVDAVAGMAATLERFRPVVWCEVRGDRGSSRAPGTLARVEEKLANLGYAPSKFDGLRQRPLSKRDRLAKGAQDVLFTVAGAEV